jgi:endonuclease YncB( thermonuclease family)
MEMTWKVRATVRRIIDGDTFAADLDLGWGVWRLESAAAPCRIRILNYDTPERGQPGHAEATHLLASLLPVTSICWVESLKLESLGRVLAHVYTPDGVNILDLLPVDWRV